VPSAHVKHGAINKKFASHPIKQKKQLCWATKNAHFHRLFSKKWMFQRENTDISMRKINSHHERTYTAFVFQGRTQQTSLTAFLLATLDTRTDGVLSSALEITHTDTIAAHATMASANPTAR
jgi:hypothetical protein